MIRRVAALFGIILFTALGSGSLEYLHNLDHLAEDARQDAADRASGKPVPPEHEHDDSNCAIHAQLHMPLISLAWTPAVLICLGTFVSFLTLRDEPLIARPLPLRIGCRGPPMICWFL